MKKKHTRPKRCCRFCATPLDHQVLDLGMSPFCQKHVSPEELYETEFFYPLNVFVCHHCWLVQLVDEVQPEALFAEDYAYFSSYSSSWLEHAKQYTKAMVERFGISSKDLVVEVASNDGYLLQWFVAEGIPVLGIEPAKNTAEAARDKGIRTESIFFGAEVSVQLQKKYGKADLLLGNNVLAHVPDINDFVKGMKSMLAPNGILTMEFPYLVRLIKENQFDTIYHEHYSYFSFTAVNRIFQHHGIELFDVQELSTHGGSLRIFGRHAENTAYPVTTAVKELIDRENVFGIETLDYYQSFEEQVKETKRKLLEFLIDAKRRNKTVVGYGAPGKSTTLLNYCGIRTDFLDFTVDRNPYKQGNFLPGTHIPIYGPEKIGEVRPDYILILPWNLKEEISRQLAYVSEWGCRLVVPIPEVEILETPALSQKDS